MKKFLSLLLAMAMLLSLCPTFTMAAEAAENDVKLYDAHITGNVVIGGTLTANFKPALTDADIANLCPGLDVDKTKASIKWYARNRYSNRSQFKTLDTTGTTEYTITDTALTGYGIFFTVTPTDANGKALGKTIVSAQTFNAAAINSDATAPSAYNVVILPQNGDGILNVGKTVAARFSFRYPKSASIANGNTLYEWYTSDNLLLDSEMSEATVVQSESNNPLYTIKNSDAGKWLYVKVTPVAADGAIGTAVYSRNHLANPFLGYDAKDVTSSQFNSSTTYPNVKSLADGAAPAGNTGGTNMSTFMMSYNNTADVVRSVTLDAGKVVPFDHFYLRNVNASIKTLKISYSAQEDVADKADIVWTDVIDQTGLALVAGHREFDCNGLLYGRYFKLEFTHVKNNAIVEEFYPFSTNTTSIDFTKSTFAQLNGSDIEVKAWGTPLSEVKKAENGFKVISILDEEGSTTIGDSIAAGASFVTKSVTSDGAVYTEIANPENITVTEELENTYLKVDDGKQIIYCEIKYAGNIVETKEDVITSAAGQLSSTLKFVGDAKVQTDSEGNTIGKYLMKTQIKIPKLSETSNSRGIRTTINAYQGKSQISYVLVLNGWYTLTNWGDSSWEVREIGIPKGGVHTGYFFNLDKWLDLEMLFDFDSASASDGTINITTWVDGILVAEDVHPWADPKTVTGGDASVLSPTLQLYPNNSTDMVYHKNSSLRQVWDADTHVVENGYELKITNAADESEAKAVTAGDYTVSNSMNVYKGNSIADYIAKYYVNDGSRELVDFAVVKDAEDVVTVTEEELAGNNVEIKAFSFCDKLTPNYVSVSVAE